MPSITTERTATSNIRTKLEYINDHNIIIQWNNGITVMGWDGHNQMLCKLVRNVI